MTEAQFQTRFNRWIRHVFPGTAAYELKQTASSLPFTAVAEHQRDALLAVKQGTFIWKIPDLGSHNPWDSFSMHKEKAYVVILFNQSKNFYLIDIEVFLRLEEESTRKSLTEAMAIKHAYSYGYLR